MAIVFNSANTQSVRENLAANSAIYTAAAVFDAGESGEIRYSLSGADASLLTIDQFSGMVTVNESTDYEQKSVYNFTVTASDGTSTELLDVSINVQDSIEGDNSDNIIVINIGCKQ